MQSVLIEKPYQFVPAIKSALPQRLLLAGGFLRRNLARESGVVEHQCQGLQHLRDSLAVGHSVMLTPNHPRTSDAVAMGFVAQETPCPMYIMASWHLFNQGRWKRFLIRSMGAFSVYREGLDRQAIDEAIRILHTAERPLLIFPEGTTSRTNDHLLALMEGPSFIARTAAKRRAKEGKGKVVAHPVAIRYLYKGDVVMACEQVLDDIERKLTWRPSRGMPLIERIVKVGNALLTLKELQYGIEREPNACLRSRQTNMVNHLLLPLEREWLGGHQDQFGIATRVKNLRMKIFPDLAKSELEEAERSRRWRQLEDTYLAQQIDCYPAEYITRYPSVDRVLEVVEKFEEDLLDAARVHGPMKIIIRLGEAVEVAPERDRKATEDPLMSQIKSCIEAMLADLQTESEMLK